MSIFDKNIIDKSPITSTLLSDIIEKNNEREINRAITYEALDKRIDDFLKYIYHQCKFGKNPYNGVWYIDIKDLGITSNSALLENEDTSFVDSLCVPDISNIIKERQAKLISYIKTRFEDAGFNFIHFSYDGYIKIRISIPELDDLDGIDSYSMSGGYAHAEGVGSNVSGHYYAKSPIIMYAETNQNDLNEEEKTNVSTQNTSANPLKMWWRKIHSSK